MACGLEMRVPFADEKIVEYAYNLPWALKSLRGREKGLLRQAFTGLLPEDVLWRKKSPYPKSWHPLYVQTVMDLFREAMDRPDSRIRELVDEEFLTRLARDPGLLPQPWYGQLMGAPQVFAYLIQMDAWLRTWQIRFV